MYQHPNTWWPDSFWGLLLSLSLFSPRASVQLSRQDHAEQGPLSASRALWQRYVLCTHLSVDNVLKKCPLPALVIGNPLTMNNDRHQGAKCPVQDTVGISLLTGGEQHLFGCWMQRWFISLTNTPRVLKLQSAVSEMHWGMSFIQCQSNGINTGTYG